MIDIKSLGYVRVDSTDLDQWRTFGGKVLGLAEGRGPNPDHLYFRMDEMSARIIVSPAERTGSAAPAGRSPTTRPSVRPSTTSRTAVSMSAKARPTSSPSAVSRA